MLYMFLLSDLRWRMLQHISAVYQISWKDAVQNHELLRTAGETARETLLITFICGESVRSLSVASSTLLVRARVESFQICDTMDRTREG